MHKKKAGDIHEEEWHSIINLNNVSERWRRDTRRGMNAPLMFVDDYYKVTSGLFVIFFILFR